MEDMLLEDEVISKDPANSPEKNMANCFGNLLKEHKGQDVAVLDLRGISDWIDFFIIATVTSNAHMDGLERHIMDFCREKEIEVIRKSRKTDTDDEWRLIDLGSMFIHLMTANAREFYELERLWHKRNEK